MMRQMLLYIFISFYACSLCAEQFKITGKVIDAKDSVELIGAGVYDVNAHRRTYTDIDGNFSIEVEKGAILKFSFCGYYEKEVEVLNDSSLVIELEVQNTAPSPLYRITGKVTDAEYKEPLIGATVEIKGQGSQPHTATDIDGNFSIPVEKGQILKFSYVGYYSKEVEVLNDSSLVIELEEDTSRHLSDDFDYTIGQGPNLCPCTFHTLQRNRIKQNQSSMKNH